MFVTLQISRDHERGEQAVGQPVTELDVRGIEYSPKVPYYLTNLNAGVQVGDNAKRMRFQLKGLDNIKLSENARFVLRVSKFRFYMM